jgi:phage gp36-like protein
VHKLKVLQVIMSQLLKLTLNKPGHIISIRSALAALLLSALCIMQYAHAEGTGRIVKWKDEKGITHYGDSIPPQYSDRDNSLMNKQGITIQHNKANAPHEDKEAELAKLEQDKKDRALLGTFTTVDEIDLTRDRNLEPELLALKNMQLDRAVAQKNLDKSKATADAFSKSRKPVPPAVSADLKTYKDGLAKIDQRINERQRTIDNIRQRFEDDKKRYLILRGQSVATPADAANK